jgi:hypothetical protein
MGEGMQTAMRRPAEPDRPRRAHTDRVAKGKATTRRVWVLARPGRARGPGQGQKQSLLGYPAAPREYRLRGVWDEASQSRRPASMMCFSLVALLYHW